MSSSRGNALFLILIAVALFAALSYAVTQSGRGGSGINKEKALLNAAQLTQYGASLEAALTRMTLTGTAADSIAFCSFGGVNDSSASCAVGVNEFCTTGTDCLFAAEGGGVVPRDDIDTGETASIIYISPDATIFHFNVGTALPDSAITVQVSLEVCEAINDGLGLVSPPGQDGAGLFTIDAYSEEYSGCYENSGGGSYFFYHVLRAQ